MFEAEMFWGFGFWLPFGVPAEFLRGLIGANSLCAEWSRCADKLSNKINFADMQPIKVKGAHLLAIKTNSDVEMIASAAGISVTGEGRKIERFQDFHHCFW